MLGMILEIPDTFENAKVLTCCEVKVFVSIMLAYPLTSGDKQCGQFESGNFFGRENAFACHDGL